MFSQRHYIELARVLAESHPSIYPYATKEADAIALDQWETTRSTLCQLLAGDNLSFRLDLFLAATEPPNNAQPAVASNTGSQSEADSSKAP